MKEFICIYLVLRKGGWDGPTHRVMIVKRALQIFEVLFVVNTLLLGIAAWAWFAEKSFDAKLHAYPVNVSKVLDTVFYMGPITEESANRLEQVITTGERPSTVMFDSIGGDLTAAKRIVAILSKEPKIEFNISGQFCGSSCVYIFTHVPLHVVDDTSVLAFHRQALVGPIAHFQDLRSRLGFRVEDYKPFEMLDWAGLISPRLKAFFEGCSPNPAMTETGIKLKWKTIRTISEGTNPYTCRELQSGGAL